MDVLTTSSKSHTQNIHLEVIINITLLRIISKQASKGKIHTSVLDKMCSLHLGILNAPSHSQEFPLLPLSKNGT
jgi:hypothetical protein